MIFNKYFHNKYFYTGLTFLVWMIFFDQENFVEQYHLTRTYNDLESKKKFYQEEISSNKKKINLLETDAEYIEKFAREKYYMKKENEDVFVIIRENED